MWNFSVVFMYISLFAMFGMSILFSTVQCVFFLSPVDVDYATVVEFV
jgi:hypothetical protein